MVSATFNLRDVFDFKLKGVPRDRLKHKTKDVPKAGIERGVAETSEMVGAIIINV